MDTVRIYHPRLVGQSADVPESAVAHHVRAGWTAEKPDWAVEQEQAEQAERDKTEKAKQAPETSGASSLEAKSPRRRRQTEESD